MGELIFENHWTDALCKIKTASCLWCSVWPSTCWTRSGETSPLAFRLIHTSVHGLSASINDLSAPNKQRCVPRLVPINGVVCSVWRNTCWTRCEETSPPSSRRIDTSIHGLLASMNGLSAPDKRPCVPRGRDTRQKNVKVSPAQSCASLSVQRVPT